MFRCAGPFAFFAASAVLLAGCTPTEPAPDDPPSVAPLSVECVTAPCATRMLAADNGSFPPAGLQGFDMVVANDGTLRGALRRMGPNSNPAALGQLIKDIRKGGGGDQFAARGLTGLGGVVGHALLDAADETLTPGSDNRDPNAVVTVASSGRITDYSFDPATGSGRIHVDTTVTTTRTVGSGQPIEKSKGFRFHVRVNGGLDVKAKTPTTSPVYNASDVFPGTGIEISAATAANFDYKLYAVGTSIRVDRLWVDNNGDGTFGSNEEIEPNSTGWKAQYTNLLKPDPANCIDMMFQQFGTTAPYIPTTYAQIGTPPNYCLGRCSNPPLINTK